LNIHYIDKNIINFYYFNCKSHNQTAVQIPRGGRGGHQLTVSTQELIDMM
jgi:hypothetical protein